MTPDQLVILWFFLTAGLVAVPLVLLILWLVDAIARPMD